MCGIIGYMGKLNALDVVMQGLEHLEYRGYDSAGFALRVQKDEQTSDLIIEKSVGKLRSLQEKIQGSEIFGTSGMGHTRWATHGVPNFSNAHPHRYKRVVVVHNGILENHQTIRRKLIEKGHSFNSDTDTEVASHLLESFLADGKDHMSAIAMLCDTVHGAYSFGIMFEDEPGKLFFAKNGSPLIVARKNNEVFFASDQAALVDHQPEYAVLDDQDMGYIAAEGVFVCDLTGKPKDIRWSPLTAKKENVQKNGHKHFMHKEIFEQAATIDRVLLGRLSKEGIDFLGFDVDFDRAAKAKHIHIIACGSSYYAGLIARSSLEMLTKIPVSVEIASEYRYRDCLTDKETLLIAISQSGETVDTLAALKKGQERGAMCMSICNVLGSAIAAFCMHGVGNLFLNAGPEISVASTKAFVAQLVALRIFSAALAKKLNRIDKAQEQMLFVDFIELKKHVTAMLLRDEEIKAIANRLLEQPRMLYLGRGDLYPVALEGALKMKELAYTFAEGYPAGELKHGPIATIDPGMPAVVLFADDGLQMKTASNLQEIKARSACVISIAPKSLVCVEKDSDYFFPLPDCKALLMPILATIPLQLLAYHVADLKNLDVDKPRNLAKSVTVE